MLSQGEGLYNITGTLADILPVSGSGDLWADMLGVKLTARADLEATPDQRLEVREVRLSLASEEVEVRWWVCSTCHLQDDLLNLWHLLAHIVWLQVTSSQSGLTIIARLNVRM